MCVQTVAVQCEGLSDPENGYVQVTSMVYLSVAQYKCFSGFELTGLHILRCEDDGNWSGPPSICSGKRVGH